MSEPVLFRCSQRKKYLTTTMTLDGSILLFSDHILKANQLKTLLFSFWNDIASDTSQRRDAVLNIWQHQRRRTPHSHRSNSYCLTQGSIKTMRYTCTALILIRGARLAPIGSGGRNFLRPTNITKGNKCFITSDG